MNPQKGLAAVNAVLWTAQAFISFFLAHSPGAGVLGCLGICIAVGMWWIEAGK